MPNKVSASNWLGLHFSNKPLLHTSKGNGTIPKVKLESYQPIPGVLAFKPHREKTNGKCFEIRGCKARNYDSVTWTHGRLIAVEANKVLPPEQTAQSLLVTPNHS